MKTTTKNSKTILRAFAAFKRPYGCPCYEAQIIDTSIRPIQNQVIWTGGQHMDPCSAECEAKTELAKRL
jgi:hypothetical protein